MATLQEIRARIAALESKNQKTSQPTSDGAIYPHWNIDEGTAASLRFLPDKNTSNPYFWVERQLIKLPFNGVKGDANSKLVTATVPCIEMFGPEYHCPILAEVRQWYKDPSLTETANKYWKKRSYLFQGFVRSSPMVEEKTPENPIRRFIVSPQIFAIIKASIMDPEMEELPTDYARGLDFNIKKFMKGNYADYSTSNWSRKETALTEAEHAAIEQYGLFDLAEFLPKMPTEAELNIIKEMFDESVNGGAYDPNRWGSYCRPWGVDAPESAKTTDAVSSAPVTKPVVTPATDDEQPVVVPPTPKSDKAGDILAMIRARQQGKVS